MGHWDKTLFKHLRIEGENVSIALTAVNKKDECYDSQKASLSSSGLHDDQVVEFQKVFSIDTLPIKPNNSSTVNELNTWPHLKGLHITKLSAPVGLLIRIDNPELFWTLEKRRETLGQPYAIRTRLC